MAISAKAKAPASDSFMTVDKMKPMLALSKREPVQAAIGLTADGEGVIFLDKKMKPKKVMAMLKASAGKSKIQLQAASLRFGRAEVDTEYDSGMVRFFVNKSPPGNLRVKLIEVVKRIPYQKVEINVDPSLEDEPEEDDAAAPETTAQSEAADPLRAAYESRLAELEPRLAEALRAQHPESTRLRAVSAFAQEHAASGDYPSGMKALDAMLRLLDGGTAAAPAAQAPAGEEPEEPSKAFNGRLSALVPQIQQAMTDGAPDAQDLRKKAGEAGVAARGKDFAAANGILDEVESTLETSGARAKAKLAAWQAAWQDAVDDIREVIEAVRETGDPDAGKVEIVLSSIVKNLTKDPATPQQYDELLRYIDSDDVLTAAEAVPAGYGSLDLRAPLRAALTGAY